MKLDPTPQWDAVLAEWVTAHPDQPKGPRFTDAECEHLNFDRIAEKATR